MRNRWISKFLEVGLRVHDVVVIPRGRTAGQTVTEAQAKRRMGNAQGKLHINIDNVRLTSGRERKNSFCGAIQAGPSEERSLGVVPAKMRGFLDKLRRLLGKSNEEDSQARVVTWSRKWARH